MRQGCFVSDLHLFTRRSQAARFQSEIVAAARAASVFVLGGDIFDFGWTAYATLEEAIPAARRWLADLCRRAPGTQFWYLLGNHDCHRLFVEAMRRLEDELANFRLEEFVLRLGNAVFLHGDVVDHRQPESFSQARARWGRAPRHGRLMRVVYHLAIRSYAHVLIHHAAFPRARVLRRLTRYLESLGHGPDQGVRRVFFGHTHLCLDGVSQGKLTFHNGGAPIRGLRFRLIPFEYEPPA